MFGSRRSGPEGDVEPLLFSRESLGRRASCARGRCYGEDTSRVSAKFLVISFALLLVDALKQEGNIPPSLLP
jgi:hypothetical protein